VHERAMWFGGWPGRRFISQALELLGT